MTYVVEMLNILLDQPTCSSPGSFLPYCLPSRPQVCRRVQDSTVAAWKHSLLLADAAIEWLDPEFYILNSSRANQNKTAGARETIANKAAQTARKGPWCMLCCLLGGFVLGK
jgi:hypothetical protein